MDRLLEGLEEEEPGQVLLLDFAEDEEGRREPEQASVIEYLPIV